MTTWKDAATAAAARLDTLYRTDDVFSGNFWFGGNALHAFLGSCLAVGRADDGRLLPYAFTEVYQRLLTQADWWHDDYGWWGNAFCLALRNRAELGYADPSNDGLFDSLLGAAADCWTRLDEYWRKDEPYGPSTDNSAGQADITAGSFNVLEPSQVMSGRNCVTNEGFWLLSLELFTLTKEPGYATRADDEAAWFRAWLERGKDGAGVLDSRSLVLERPTGHRLLPGWYWAGDQGLFMAVSLTQLSRQWPPPYDDSLAATIATQVMTVMVDADGVLHENLEFSQGHPPLGEFLADYATGKGVFMRNLGYVADILGQPWRTAHCEDFIRRNASAVWGQRDPESNQVPFNWNPSGGGEPRDLTGKSTDLCDLIVQACGVDALNLAARYLPNGEAV